MDQVEHHPLTGDHPETIQGTPTEPRGFIDIVDRGLPCLRRYRYIIRVDDLGYPIEDLLDGPQADGHLQHRGAKGLHQTPAIAVRPCQLPHQGTAAGAIAAGMLGRDVRVTPAPTRRTPALMPHPVRHLHRDRGQCNHLRRIGGARPRKREVAAHTRLGMQLHDACGR
jgi:hypothetical protein